MSERSLYYASKLLAQTGQNLLWAALFVAAGTGENASLGISSLFVAQLVPSLLLGMPGGAIADQLGPARGMVVGAALRFAALAVGILLIDGSTSAWMIAGLYSAVSQVFTPAEMAMVRSLRHETSSRAHSVVVALQYGGQGLGVVVLAPALYLAGGPTLMLAACALLFAAQVPVAALLGWRLRGTAATHMESTREAFAFGDVCRFFLREDVARYAVVTLALKTVVSRGIIVALPLYLRHDLGLPNSALAYLVAPGVIGIVLGLAWTNRGVNLERSRMVMRYSVAGLVVAVFALAMFDYGLAAVVNLTTLQPISQLRIHMNATFVVALPAAFLLGLGLSTTLVSARVALTESAPVGQQSRVFATQETLTEGLLVLPMLLTGIGAEIAGARMTLAAIGMVSLAAFVIIELPRLREARLPVLRKALPARA
ncbi:MAG: MFS transporter [Dehalococcoidia bacterium]|nr:MFS transporter [Dehalococcoidia bacterium]